MQARSRDDRSLGELFGDLTRELGTLFRSEVTLAKTEMTQKAAQAGKDVGFLAAGGAVAYAGLLTLIAALVLGLATFMPAWVSALIVGLIVVAIGAFLVYRGFSNLKHEDFTPQQTIESLQEDATWAKHQMS